MSSRILLVEDEPGLVLTITDLLNAEGYAVESATDGPTGLTKALNERFDLIVIGLIWMEYRARKPGPRPLREAVN